MVNANPSPCFLRRRETRKAKKEAVTWRPSELGTDRQGEVGQLRKICWSFSILCHVYSSVCEYIIYIYTLPETNIFAPENGWLED